MVVKVVAAAMENDGRYFIVKRPMNGQLPGKWEFPGGKMEPGESPEESLRRELMEEFSIETEVGHFIGSHEHQYEIPGLNRINLMAYRVNRISGDIVLNEHTDMAWVAPEEMLQYEFVDADYFLVEHLRAGG